eukprot:1317766-Pleurochrysis_carterae.AAC.2
MGVVRAQGDTCRCTYLILCVVHAACFLRLGPRSTATKCCCTGRKRDQNVQSAAQQSSFSAVKFFNSQVPRKLSSLTFELLDSQAPKQAPQQPRAQSSQIAGYCAGSTRIDTKGAQKSSGRYALSNTIERSKITLHEWQLRYAAFSKGIAAHRYSMLVGLPKAGMVPLSLFLKSRNADKVICSCTDNPIRATVLFGLCEDAHYNKFGHARVHAAV